MHVRLRSIGIWSAMRVGCFFHALFLLLIAFPVSGWAIVSFQDNRAGELILLAVAVVLGGGLIGALVFGAAAASYNWAAAMVGGIEGDLRKVSARVEVTESYRPRSFQTIIPMDTTITPPRKMKVAPRDGQAQPEPPMTPEERRKFHDRLYRIERYYRMQRRRLEIRDE